jgi:hypothetical protein
MMLGGGEGRGVMMRGSAPTKAVNTIRPYNPLAARQQVRAW